MHNYSPCLSTGMHNYFRLNNSDLYHYLTCSSGGLQVFYNTVRLGIYRTKRDDLRDYNRPVKLGNGLATAYQLAYDRIFTAKQPWELSDTEVERRGAWLLLAAQALAAYNSQRSGTRDKGKGMQSELLIEGFSTVKINKLITKLKDIVGDTPNSIAIRKRKQGS